MCKGVEMRVKERSCMIQFLQMWSLLRRMVTAKTIWCWFAVPIFFAVLMVLYKFQVGNLTVTLTSACVLFYIFVSFIYNNQKPALCCFFVTGLFLYLFAFSSLHPTCGELRNSYESLGREIQKTKPNLMFNQTWSKGQQIPYINNLEYLQSLNDYAYSFPSKRGYIVWGPTSTGKSNGLTNMVEIWHNQGRVIVDLDFKNFCGDHEAFKHQFRVAVSGEWEKFHFNRNDIHNCFRCSNFLNQTEFEYKFDNGFIGWILSAIIHKTLPATLSKHIAKWRYDYLIKSMFTSVDSTISFSKIIDSMELMALQKPSAAPIIIFRELQNLYTLNGGELIIQDIITHISRRKSSTSLIPIIIETSDYMW